LPSWFLPHRWYVLIESTVRLVIAAASVTLTLFMRRPLARMISSAPITIALSALAAALSFGASELVLSRVHLRATEWLMPEEEPQRRHDARLGWTFVPARKGYSTIGGRVVEYAFDRAGYRVRSLDEPVDHERPTILFVGESVM